MEPRPNFHPVYVSGQYLTSEHLNETQDFLWQEEKATRYMLAGNGIVRGLDADFTGTTFLQKVSLTNGFAATSDGYLVQAKTADGAPLSFDKGVSLKLTRFTTTNNIDQVLEETEFNKVQNIIKPVSFKTIDVLELFIEKTPVEELPNGSKDLLQFSIDKTKIEPNYLLLAWVFINDKQNDHCQQGDCNTKGIQRNYVVRYFLIENKLFDQLNSITAELPLCLVSRIKNLSGVTSVNGFNLVNFAAWTSSFAELQGYFAITETGKQLKRVAELLGPTEQAALPTAISKINQVNGSVTNASCQQYYLAFATDLAKAINELAVFHNDYSRKYPVITQKRIEGVIIVGSFKQPVFDKWRYYFIPSTATPQYNFDKKKLSKLFMRVMAMVNQFIVQANISTQLSKVINRPLAIPSSIDSELLQNSAIAYYYDVMQAGVDNEVLKNWNPQGGNLKNIFCYYDSLAAGRSDMSLKLATADWSASNFFRVEGHIGLKKEVATAAINSLINNDGVPIQVIDCDVNYKGPSKWIDWYDEFVGNLGTWVGELRDKFPDYDYAPLKNLHVQVTQVSYREVDKVAKYANDFYAYSGVLHGVPPPPPPNKPPPIAITAYNRYKTIVPKQAVNNTYAKFKDALSEQADVQQQKLIVLKDLVGLEYRGGAPRGGTFVLLHSGGNVVGDGCLSYIYRVSQARVFNPSTKIVPL